MNYPNLPTIKGQVLENIDRLYPNRNFKTIEDIILYLDPVDFDYRKISFYEDEYLFAISCFLKRFNTSFVYWQKYLNNEEVKGFRDWFIDDVHEKFYLKV